MRITNPRPSLRENRGEDCWITGPAVNQFASCDHAWEYHLWDQGEAYCPRCGGYADAPDDPRLAKRAERKP